MLKIPHEVRVLLVGCGNLDYQDFRSLFEDFHELRVELEWLSGLQVGLQAIQERRHDLYLITDESEAGSGVELLKQCSLTDADPPVLMILSKRERGSEADALRVGAADCLFREQVTPDLLERAMRFSIYRYLVKKELRAKESEIMMQERLASVGLLASGMAHEIGTPLGVIRGRAEVLLIRNQGVGVLERDLQIIIAQVDRVSKLMKSLLNLARGDGMGSGGSIELKGVVTEVLEVLSNPLREQKIEVLDEVPSGIWIRAQSEGEPFHQILMNLLMNSMQAIGTAIEQGRSGMHRIRLTVDEEEDKWALRVSDSGCGITPENQRRLFRPFFTTKGVGRGTGLGLALSLRIVESWKGTIRVESAENRGATFIVSVPKGRSIAAIPV
jgi:signal transduction histidine kinase